MAGVECLYCMCYGASVAFAWLAGLSAGIVEPLNAQFSAAGIDDPKLVFAFLSDLQKAVATDDAAMVATLASFPVDVFIRKQRRRVRSSAAFQKLYPQIFTPCLKRVIAAARREDLFANWRGVMLGQGAIWFGMQRNGKIRFFTINGPVDGELLCKESQGP